LALGQANSLPHGISIASVVPEHVTPMNGTSMLDTWTQFGVHWVKSILPSSMIRACIVVTAAVFAFCTHDLHAQATAQQSVSLEVRAVTKIAVSGNPGSLILSDAVAGSSVMSAEDQSTSYSVTTNLDNMKIVVSIDSPMPAGTRLMMNVASARGVSTGLVDISNATSPIDAVTGISRGSESAQPISYVFAADASVGSVPTQSRTITLTLTN